MQLFRDACRDHGVDTERSAFYGLLFDQNDHWVARRVVSGDLDRGHLALDLGTSSLFPNQQIQASGHGSCGIFGTSHQLVCSRVPACCVRDLFVGSISSESIE
jgi:hypothetical protein